MNGAQGRVALLRRLEGSCRSAVYRALEQTAWPHFGAGRSQREREKSTSDSAQVEVVSLLPHSFGGNQRQSILTQSSALASKSVTRS